MVCCFIYILLLFLNYSLKKFEMFHGNFSFLFLFGFSFKVLHLCAEKLLEIDWIARREMISDQNGHKILFFFFQVSNNSIISNMDPNWWQPSKNCLFFMLCFFFTNYILCAKWNEMILFRFCFVWWFRTLLD